MPPLLPHFPHSFLSPLVARVCCSAWTRELWLAMGVSCGSWRSEDTSRRGPTPRSASSRGRKRVRVWVWHQYVLSECNVRKLSFLLELDFFISVLIWTGMSTYTVPGKLNNLCWMFQKKILHLTYIINLWIYLWKSIMKKAWK